MKIITWNVNSVRARLDQVDRLMSSEAPSVLCLQEIKTEEKSFPTSSFSPAMASSSIVGQKSYNGVSIHTRKPHAYGERDPFCSASGSRVIAVTYKRIRIINAYVPNGGKDEQAYLDKLVWLEKFGRYIKRQIREHKRVVVVGDFNICPVEADTWNPKLWNGRVTCTPQERAWYARLMKLDLVDAYLAKNGRHDFTWWNYRADGFTHGHGLRLDHILVTPDLIKHIADVRVLSDYRGMPKASDHAPVMLEIRKKL